MRVGREKGAGRTQRRRHSDALQRDGVVAIRRRWQRRSAPRALDIIIVVAVVCCRVCGMGLRVGVGVGVRVRVRVVRGGRRASDRGSVGWRGKRVEVRIGSEAQTAKKGLARNEGIERNVKIFI